MSARLIDKYDPPPISREEDMEYLERMTTRGFMVMKLSPSVLGLVHDSLLARVKGGSEFRNDHENITGGYSIGAGHLLENEHRQYFKDFGDYLCKQKFVRDYVNFPKVVDISVMYTLYNEKAATNPTHAHLWHRDGADSRQYITIEVPLVECTPENGMFSAMSKNVCAYENSLRDRALMGKLADMPKDDYRYSDMLYRLSDSTVRSSISKDDIFDFQNKLGDALLVDTGRCYHKGALVLGPGQYRIMVQLMIGGLTHAWRTGQTVLKQRAINVMYRLVGKRSPRRLASGDIFIG